MRPIVIDLFAGVGGLSLGFEQAGFDVACAVEYDPVHAAAHAYNFPQTVVLPMSVRDVTGAQIRDASGIGSAPVFAVIGGPPCQGFSSIGKKTGVDPRNDLVSEFARVVDELGPSYFVFENVKGLTEARNATTFAAIKDLFEGIGYDIVPHRLLNAMHYGVPQSRERLLLIGVRRGAAAPVYPKPLDTMVTCHDALGDLPNLDDFEALLHTDAVICAAAGPISSYAAEMRCVSPAGWHYGYRRDFDPSVMTGSARTVHTEATRCRFAETGNGRFERYSNFFKLAPDGVSNTLRAGTDSKRGSFTSARPIHYRHPRCISVREMARLHGMPDWFRLNVTKWHGARQVGNAVPPPLARALAASLAEAAGYMPTTPTEVLTLGSQELLEFDMTAACAYFGVSNPIGQRDRPAPPAAVAEGECASW